MRRMTETISRHARRLARLVFALGSVGAASLTLAPEALAAAYGRGLWGGVDDKVVTDFGFILIGGFPLLILVFSLIQWRLDKRKEARKASEKALLGNATWHGGW